MLLRAWQIQKSQLDLSSHYSEGLGIAFGSFAILNLEVRCVTTHLLSALDVLFPCEKEQHRTCTQNLGLCCSQGGVHPSASMVENLGSCCYRCKNFWVCNEMRAEMISSDPKRKNVEVFHSWLRAEAFCCVLANAAKDTQLFISIEGQWVRQK